MKYCDQCGKELQDNEVCNCQENNVEEVQANYTNTELNYQPKPKSLIGNYLTAIIYPLIFVILAVLLFNQGETTIVGMIVAILMDIAAAVVILLGGFYFLIIPLPYIYFFKAGCLKDDLSTGKKVLYGILAFALLIGSFGIMFLFHAL